MEYTDIADGKMRISKVGIGTWQGAGEDWGSDVETGKIKDAIIRANELGVNLIDTAEVYGEGQSEKIVGRALEELDRDDVIVATKVNAHLRYDDVKKACENSLERLNIEKIDVYQIHWPDPWQQIPMKETMRAMEDLYLEGKIENIGVSNFAVRDLREARESLEETDVIWNQVRYNMLERQIEREVLPYCRREDIAVIAYSPLAQGALTGKYGPENLPVDNIRTDRPTFRNNIFKKSNLKEISDLLSVMEDISNNHDKTVAQIAINWVARKSGVIPIVGAKRPEQAEWNANAVGWEISEDEAEEIDRELNRLELDFF